MEKLFEAVNHCHANNIAHRDLKPENVLVSENFFSAIKEGHEGTLKLIDFGLAKHARSPMETIVGSAFYVAPEIVSGEYGTQCDLWSLGVLLYIPLSGTLPFKGHDAHEVLSQIAEKSVSFPEKIWGPISKEATDLI